MISQKVIVIGNGPSGIDISDQLAPFCSSLIVSAHTPSEAPQLFPNIISLPEIISLDNDISSIRFANGHVEKGVDAIIFCTGYLYSLPFLHLPESSPPTITTGERVQNTYEHIFYSPDPTVSFVGLPQRIIPFPDAESQSSVIARVYSGRLELPDFSVMKSWEADRIKEKGDRRAFHLMPFPEDRKYMNDLYLWAEKAGEGLMPKWWDEEATWIRERASGLKGAIRKLNIEGAGSKVSTIEQLGLSFEEWKKEKERADKHVL
jgi:cation diffusion facilitator CzcD-associated flavoprotein CzcO